MTRNIKSLASRTALASTWVVGAKLMVKFVDLLTLVILARFVGPSDFGIVAMAMTVIFVVEAILELPLASVLVAQPNITDELLSTALTLGVIRSACVGLVLVLSAWPLAFFYREPRLVELVYALSLAPIMRGLISPRLAVFAKELDFRRDAAIEIAGKCVAATAAVTVAAMTGSYWAIAVNTLGAPMIMAVLSYIFAPMRLTLCLREWKIFSGVFGWNTLAQTISAVNWQIDRLVLPRFIDASLMGRYAISMDLVSVPHQAIIAPISRPLLSALVEAHQKQRFSIAYQKASGLVVLLMTLVLGFVAVMSETLIGVVLDARWVDAAPILVGLAISNLVSVPMLIMPTVALVFGRFREVAVRLAVEFVVRVPLTLGGIMLWGVSGAIGAKAIAAAAATAAGFFLIRGVTGIAIRTQMTVFIRPMLALAPAASAVHFAVRPFFTDMRIISGLIHLLVAGVVYVTVYSASVFALWVVSGRPEGTEAFLFGRFKEIRKRVGGKR